MEYNVTLEITNRFAPLLKSGLTLPLKNIVMAEEEKEVKGMGIHRSSGSSIDAMRAHARERESFIEKMYGGASSFMHRDSLMHSQGDILKYYDIGSRDKVYGDFMRPGTTFDTELKLADEINDLKKQLKKLAEEFDEKQNDHAKRKEHFENLIDQLESKQKIKHILTRISEDGVEKLLTSEAFLKLFNNSTKCDSVVVSIDIRRSTELMLKARTPELFSKFITDLSQKLSQVIMLNYGIFDKFTGDGILAFFPKFYSDENAIVRAVRAANECHHIFEDHYNKSKDCFNVFIKDIGLGIGIDYGNVTLVNTQNELTVVGVPVVYACRFSGAKAGETLLNQPAKEEVEKQCANQAFFEVSEINIKNEGVALGYNVTLNHAAFDIKNPDWDKLMETYKEEEK